MMPMTDAYDQSSGSDQVPILRVKDLEADPHSAFRYWRQRRPVVAFEGGYFVLRHEAVVRLSKDERLRATETAFPRTRGISDGHLFEFFQNGMLTANDGIHATRRLPVSHALATRLIDDVRRHARASARRLIAAFPKQEPFDFVGHFAALLPIHVLASLLAVPEQEQAAFTDEVQQFSTIFRPSSGEKDVASSSDAAGHLFARLRSLCETRRHDPQDDIISHLVSSADDHGLNGEEVLAQVTQLIIGGTESMRATIAGMTGNLLLRRAQWREVCQGPELVAAAVREAMRYEPGIAGLVRIAAEPMDIDGTTIPGGALVVLSIMSALRDEEVYHDPDVFDIHRAPGPFPHLAFGAGVHHCVGRALGLAQLEECLAVLTSTLPGLRLEDVPVVNGFMFTRDPSPMCVSHPDRLATD